MQSSQGVCHGSSSGIRARAILQCDPVPPGEGRNPLPAVKEPSARTAIAWMSGALILLAAAGALILDTERRQARRNAWSELESIAGFSSGQVGIWRLDQITDAGTISTDPLLTPAVSDFLESRSAPSASVLESIFRQTMLEHSYLDVMLVDSSGALLVSGSDPPLFTGGLPRDLMTTAAVTIPSFVDMHLHTGDSVPHMSVIAPLPDEDGRMRVPPTCLVLISDASSFLEPILRPGPSIGESVEVALIEVRGDEVVYLTDPERSGFSALELRIPLSDAGQVEAQAASGTRVSMSGTAYHGGRVLAAAAPVQGSPWILIAMMDESAATGGLRSRFGLLIGMLVASAFAICFVGLFLWQREKKRHFEELYRSESRLRASQDRHGITLRAVDDAVVSTDLDGRVDLINPAAEELTGWRGSEAFGRPVADVFRIVDPDSGEPVADPVAGVLAGGSGTRPSDGILVSRDGRRTPIEHSVSPIVDSGMKLTGVVLVFRDRTEERLSRGMVEIRLELIRRIAELPPGEFLASAAGLVLSLVGAEEGFFCLIGAGDSSCPPRPGPALDDVFRRCVRDGAPASSPISDGQTMAAAVPVSRDGSTAAVFAASGIPQVLFRRRMQILEYFASVILDLVERRRAKDALTESQRRSREIFEGSRDGMVMAGPDGLIIEANPAYCEMLGYTPGELVGAADPLSVSTDACRGSGAGSQAFGTSDPPGFYAMRLVRKDGMPLLVEVRAYSVPDPDGESGYRWYITRDITESERLGLETERLRTQLEQAQKLEAVGRLAGGVAHDFNNLLMGILNYAELCRESTAPGNPMRDWLDEIVHIADRSIELVKHLLAFARRQPVSPRVTDVNDAIASMMKMLGRLIGEDVELHWLPGAGVPPVMIDPAQLDQLLVNLALNARDAFEGPGVLTIETARTELDEDYCRSRLDTKPGIYAMIIVSDNGSGMSAETVAHIFEPFFTTKDVGKGAGLGLATVHGIVRQNEGFISVYSEPGQGSTFRVGFPACDGSPERHRTESPAELRTGKETVLLVEDESSVRATVEAFLVRLGYRVIPADCPERALEMTAASGERVDVLVTDVVMPGMNVREFVNLVGKANPGMKCLYMSGYTSNVIVHRGILDDSVDFLAKPFTRDQLGRKLREILGRPESGGSA